MVINLHDTMVINLHDTMVINLHDTMVINLHDTMVINLHDTMVIKPNDTMVINLHDTMVINRHDTMVINLHDTMVIHLHDTMVINLHDTMVINLHTYNNIIKRSIRKAKADYYYSRFEKYTNDIRNTWVTIKEIISRESKTNFPESFQINVWSEPSVRRISTSVSVCVGMCSVVAMQADP